MTRGWVLTIAGGTVLLALAGCGRGFFLDGQREAWRHEAEVACLKSGAVKIGVERIEPIEGPGMCGADFPFKVSALGDAASLMGYADDLRPPAAVPNSSSDMPRWPANEPRYAPPRNVPVRTVPGQGEQMRWMTGPKGIDRSRAVSDEDDEPMSISPPRAQPMQAAPMRAAPLPPPTTYQKTYPVARPSSYPRAAARPDDIPDDAEIPPGGSTAVPAPRAPRGTAAPQTQQGYNAPAYQPPRLGPTRAPYNPATVGAAELKPAATLACPLVSALDRWVSEGVQPAALRWFRSPVTEIQQLGSYSCRGMVGGAGVSEHSFGNAIDIAGFTLADGRKITVKKGWRGTPEEQGFLHDVQLYACETFNTVLAPGYNVYHYDHFHVDLSRREPGYRPCRPEAIPGEVVAAKARALYANQRRGPAYTGSLASKDPIAALLAVPGADGYVPDEDAKKKSEPLPVPSYLGRAPKLPAEDRLTAH
jgi:hypothetical protein